MIQLGLIGKNIKRSHVHRLHHSLGDLCGLNVQYTLLDAVDTPDLSLKERVDQVIEQGFRGVNITHPFKTEVAALVNTPGAVPSLLASYNTLVFREQDSIFGTNTDYSGFKAAYTRHYGEVKPGKALLIGCGGVGRSLAFGLGVLGAEHIYLHEKDIALADNLRSELQQCGYSCSLVADEALVDTAHAVDGILNATPIGMYQYPGNPLPNNCIKAQRWAFEAIYTPKKTEFVQALQKTNCDILTGYELFLNQGIDAFEHFCGIQLDRDQAINHFLNSG